MKAALLAALGLFGLVFGALWLVCLLRQQAEQIGSRDVKLVPQLCIGFVTNFMDALGVGSFAPTTAIYKLLHLVPDDLIPGTINVGGVFPVILEAFIFVVIIVVDLRTLAFMIAAAILGAWFGAGVVSRWPKQKIRIGLGTALLVAAVLTLGAQLHWYPAGGEANGLSGAKLLFAVVCNFMFGAFMQLGVGLYAPCMIVIYLLGTSPRAAFPIMMGSCAFLMPVGSCRFIRSGRYSPRAAIGLTVGGIPAILVATYAVKSMPLSAIRWLIVLVALYAGVMLLYTAFAEPAANAPKAEAQAGQRPA